MTIEEMYASIYSNDVVYCPPMEESCALLEVQLGCSWGKCAFCDFAKDKFRIHSMAKIEKNLKTMSILMPEKERVFFLGENAFCMETEKLLKIMNMCRKYLPKAKEFAMYSRTDDIGRKSDAELEKLHDAGLTDLHIGIESGSDSILAEMNKGENTFEMQMALEALDRAGIAYNVTVILGLGGKAFRNLHAIETARFLNRVHPKSIWCLNLKLWEDTPLYREALKGNFEAMTPKEMLLEERILLSQLTVKNCYYFDSTVLNLYTIKGFLPENKEELLNTIDLLLA